MGKWPSALILFFLSVVPAGAQGPARESPATKDQPDFTVESANFSSVSLDKLSLRQKIGQLFIFGFPGVELEDGLEATLSRFQPGGIIVFGRNIKTPLQIARLNYQAQSRSTAKNGLPLLIAVDQEGGSVVRIKTLPPLPSALALANTNDPELVRAAGFNTGTLLKALGFNMNLAPVLDVTEPSRDRFIGTRTFGNNPEIVTRMGREFADGLKAGGVLPTAKHFPGHGGVGADSHRVLPEKPQTLEQILGTDLVPFARIANDGPWAVMAAHIAFPNIDPSGVPATFSKILITDVLRKKIGFDGLIITDDIEMAGTFSIKDPNERAIRAIEAGVDMVMIAWNRRTQARAFDAIYKAVKSGRISEARIDESVARIIRVKRGFPGASTSEKPSRKQLERVIRGLNLKEISDRTLAAGLKRSTLNWQKKLRDRDMNAQNIFVFASSGQFYQSFKKGLEKTKSRFYRLGANNSFDINRVMRANPEKLGVFYVSGNESAKLANRIDPDVSARIVLINTETKSLLNDSTRFLHVVDVYFRHPDLGRQTAQYLFETPTEETSTNRKIVDDASPRAPKDSSDVDNARMPTSDSKFRESLERHRSGPDL